MKKSAKKILEVITLGHPILRRIAKKINDPTSPEIRTLAKGMLASMRSFKGVGIAAPQVNQSVRLIVIASTSTPFYPKAPKVKPLVMINPLLLNYSRATQKGWEGCGSLLGVRAKVSRYTWVDARFTDQKGKSHDMRLKGFLARVFQHELDHLNGIMFIDHVKMSDIVSSTWLSFTIKKKK